MPKESGKSAFEIKGPDGGLFTMKPAHAIRDTQSPDAQNFDPSARGRIQKRLGHAKFTSAAKSVPTGTFVSGLFAGTSAAAGAIKVWQLDESTGTFVDETADFNSSTSADVDPFPATEAVNDYFAIGARSTFTGLNITISTAGIGGTVAWEYYNGSTWAALTVNDGTTGFTAGTSTYVIKWTVPSAWAATTLNASESLYYVRARVTQVYATNPVLTSGSLIGRTFILAAEGSTVQEITNGSWNTAITSTSIVVDTPVDMQMFNNKILLLNEGQDPRYTTDGVASTALAGSPPSKARIGMVHRNRVFLTPGDSSVVTHSALLDEQDYTTTDNAGSITFNKGDGMVVNGMWSGQDFAIISKVSPASGGKEGKLYILYGSSPFDWLVRKIADVGAVGQRGGIAYDNFVAIATPRGVVGIQGRYPFKMSDPIDTDWTAIPNKGTIAMGRYMTKIYAAFPASGTTNNREYVLDVEHGVWGKNTGKTPSCYTNHPDGRLLFGTSGSSILVWEAEVGANDDGAAIDFYWESPDMFFDEMWSPSRLSWAYLHTKTTPSTTLTITHYVDGTATSYSDTMVTNTEGPVKQLKNFASNRGTFHRIRVRDNSTNGQTEIFSLKATAKGFQPGTQRSS